MGAEIDRRRLFEAAMGLSVLAGLAATGSASAQDPAPLSFP